MIFGSASISKSNNNNNSYERWCRKHGYPKPKPSSQVIKEFRNATAFNSKMRRIERESNIQQTKAEERYRERVRNGTLKPDEVFLNISDKDKARIEAEFSIGVVSSTTIDLIKEIYKDVFSKDPPIMTIGLAYSIIDKYIKEGKFLTSGDKLKT